MLAMLTVLAVLAACWPCVGRVTRLGGEAASTFRGLIAQREKAYKPPLKYKKADGDQRRQEKPEKSRRRAGAAREKPPKYFRKARPA
eukprot:255245-Prymnesium_polylepis.1